MGVSSFLLGSVLVLVFSVVHGDPLVPALCIFGDSVVDAGNNNNLYTVVKANFPPYGRDFVTHKPTGRFCNGKLATDFTGQISEELRSSSSSSSSSLMILLVCLTYYYYYYMPAELLGFTSYPPAYLSQEARGKNLLTGANFASAASGYYDRTADLYVNIEITTLSLSLSVAADL
jgi:hypothetical protein